MGGRDLRSLITPPSSKSPAGLPFAPWATLP